MNYAHIYDPIQSKNNVTMLVTYINKSTENCHMRLINQIMTSEYHLSCISSSKIAL